MTDATSLQDWLEKTAAERARLGNAQIKAVARAAKKEAVMAKRRAAFFAKLGIKPTWLDR